MGRVHLFLVISILICIIIVSSAGVYQTGSKINLKKPVIRMIPDNSTSIAIVNTSMGKIYAFSVNSSLGLVMHVPLPDLVLDRGKILQRENITGVSFSEFEYVHGIAIYKASGISIQKIDSRWAEYIQQFSDFLNLASFNTSTLYISDSISNYVVLGSLHAVQDSIEYYFSDTVNYSYLHTMALNLTANDSMHLSFVKGKRIDNVDINSTGDTTQVSITFASRESLLEFQVEYLYLESSGKIQPLNIVYTGNEAFINVQMNFTEFLNYSINSFYQITG